jgi:DNA-binding response OmpR family regulator
MARIAVVDDDPDVRDFISVILTEDGHEVVTADDGLSAQTVIAATPPDLMVLDILMPNRDGLATILELRREGRGFPILAMSAGGMMDSGYLLKTAKTFGADDALFKPFSPEQLRNGVNALLQAKDG